MSSTPREASGERTPLLRDESVSKGKDEHYNLAGLSQTSFWILCLSMWIAAFLVAFDGTVVATLIGPISSAFNATNKASWLGTSYLLSVCCISPIYGRMCDVIGRRVTMLISVAIFALGNMLCAAAPTMNALIVARFVAGLGGGGLQVTSSTITSDIVPLSYRGLFQGIANITFGIGTGLGAPIGGFMNDWLGWRWAFWMQAPTFVIAFIAVFFYVRYDIPSSRKAAQTPREMVKRIDFLGSFLLFGWLGTGILVLSMKTESTDGSLKWTSPLILGLIAVIVVCFIVFLFVELKFAREPVLPVELLKRRTPIACSLNNFFLSIVIFGTMYTVPLYYTAVKQFSATFTGQHFLPVPLVGMAASLSVGWYVRRYGKYKWLCFLGGVDGTICSILLATWGRDTASWKLWAFQPIGAPSGAAVTTLTVVALIADVGREGIATATSLSYVARMTGQVVGVALIGAIIQTVLSKELPKRITGPGSKEIIEIIRKSSAAIHDLEPELKEAAIISYQKATHAVFVTMIVFAVLYTLCGLGIREVDIPGASAAPTRAQTPENEDDGEEEA